MKLRGLVLCAWVFTVQAASAQAPIVEQRCLETDPVQCQEVGGRLVLPPQGCPVRSFENFYGRVAWYPFDCVGPITIEVETLARADTRFPLYVEVVPLNDLERICHLAGSVIMVARGASERCGGWESTGPVDISGVVPVGSRYALRLHLFGHPAGFSPAFQCIRVTGYPVQSSVSEGSWALVKRLYR